jgi:hypothetical protein
MVRKDTIQESLARVETSVEFIKENQTKDLSAINDHLKQLNGSVARNAARGIENMSALKTHWRLIIVIIGIGGGLIGIMLECLFKLR